MIEIAETIADIRIKLDEQERLIARFRHLDTNGTLFRRRRELQQALVYWLALEVVEAVNE
jgi:hypothetical protein